MGGKSRKTGSISKKLVERLLSQSSKGGKSSKSGVSPKGLLDKGGLDWTKDFPGDGERKKREAEGGGNK